MRTKFLSLMERRKIVMKKKKIRFVTFMVLTVIILTILCYLEKFGVLKLNPLYIGMMLSLVPGTGVAVAGIYDDNYHKINQLLYVLFLGLSALLLLNILGVLNGKAVQFAGEVVIFIGSILLMWFYKHGKEERKILRNFAKINNALILLVAILLLKNALIILVYSNEYEKILANIMSIIQVPILIFCCSVQYWGEEYAWRGVLQKTLQTRFGKRLGIVVLGMIWETYHCPLWFTVYNLHIWEVCMRYVLAISLSFVLGYLYIKTNNIWAPTIGHCIYNTVGNAGVTVQMGIFDQIIFTIILAVVFLIFAMAKEYRKKY